MTEHELRDKIVDVIIANEHKGEKNIRGETIKKYLRIADALISAGIGDVSEWKHRAEVAEAKLKKIEYDKKLVDRVAEIYNNGEHTVDALYEAFEKAENEMQEERKDD